MKLPHIKRILAASAVPTPGPNSASHASPITLRISSTAWWYLGENDKITVPNRDAANALIRMGMIEIQNETATVEPQRRDPAMLLTRPKNVL
jgi:hypothetical protein